ncbi:hypothetical protein ABW636_08940 [Aquimarina sp. 2201CG1-2-11]|uniref:hypothetical protein n=1 Tax=Aquimarina discodermiae TaxID=3231043 RepID=UPI0034617E1A
MYNLDLLYTNTVGSAFTIKNQFDEEPQSKIQFLIGDIAVLMDVPEIKSFLSVVRLAQKGCQCTSCNQKSAYRTIKCNTPQAEINFKVTPETLVGFEELVMGVLFHLEYNDVLSFNEIN